jgi:low affinity Fe/Cu permease
VIQSWFRSGAQHVAAAVGSAGAFTVAAAVIAVWAATGPLFKFSDTWQLVINTGTTIVTFLMVFLIQNTQNREAKATQLKLDELIRAVQGARNTLVDVEDGPEEELKRLEREFREVRRQALLQQAKARGVTRVLAPRKATPASSEPTSP